MADKVSRAEELAERKRIARVVKQRLMFVIALLIVVALALIFRIGENFWPIWIVEHRQARAKTGERHPGHGDHDALEQLRTYLSNEQSPIIDIGGTIIEIDTTDFAKLNYRRILHEVKSAMQNYQALGESSEKGL